MSIKYDIRAFGWVGGRYHYEIIAWDEASQSYVPHGLKTMELADAMAARERLLLSKGATSSPPERKGSR